MTDRRPGTSDQTEREPLFLRALVDNLPAMLAYWDADQRCRFANRAYEKWFGVKPEAMIGRDMKEFLGPLYPLNLPYIQGALRGEEQEFEREIPDPAGGPPRHSQAHYIPDVVDGSVRGFCVLVADITRRKRAEESLQRMERQLQATERLTAMATLAAGIAHEINNPLAAVLANVELTLSGLDRGHVDPTAIRTALIEARDAATRMRHIVQSMKLLAQGDTTKREPVDINATLERSVGLASHVIRYRARIVRDLGRVGHVEGNASQLAQVFVNLLVNAAQALPEGSAERNEIRLVSRREGDHVVVEVADNGCGIPDELQSRVFDPFFTTKDVGGGMGLGLSISSGIVNAYGGSISVKSKVGEGSVFRVVLPAATAPLPAAKTPIPLQTAKPQPAPGARLRLLVIDDEPMLTRVLKEILSESYDVTVLNSGREAITLLCEGQSRFDVILCDLMMPEVGGADVYAEVTTKRPDLARRFIFMTGGAFTPRSRQFIESIQAPIMPKPFDIGQVRELVAAQAVKAR
jgi:PAS domain S-box-containing protein